MSTRSELWGTTGEGSLGGPKNMPKSYKTLLEGIFETSGPHSLANNWGN